MGWAVQIQSEGTLKLLTLLKSPRTGKSNESRAWLFKRQPIFPFMQSQERPGHPWASSGTPGATLPEAAQLVVQAPPLVPFFPKQQSPNWILQSWLEQFLSHVYLIHFK